MAHASRSPQRALHHAGAIQAHEDMLLQSPGQSPSTSMRSFKETGQSSLTYDRLIAELPTLPAALAQLVTTMLYGTDSMDPSHIDMVGHMGGIRWWKIEPDGSKRLYYECFEICRMSELYYNAAPRDVRDMVDALMASDDTTQHRAAQLSLTQAIIDDRADCERITKHTMSSVDARQLTSRASDAVADMATFIEFCNHHTPIDTAEIYEQVLLSHGSMTGNPQRKRKYLPRAVCAGVSIKKQSMADRKVSLSDHDSGEEEEDSSPAAKLVNYQRLPEGRKSGGLKKQRKEGSLTPGKKYYHWTDARLRVWRELKGLSEEELPPSALSGALHELESTCTSATVDLRLCNFDMSIEEIYTFFPLHTIWREVCWRVMQEWSATDVIEFLYWSRDMQQVNTAGVSTLKYRYKNAGGWAEDSLADRRNEHAEAKAVGLEVSNIATSTSRRARVVGPETVSNMGSICADSGNLSCDACYPFDYDIYDLAEGVDASRFPTGKGSQLLTRVIEHVRRTQNHDLLLGGVVDYARQHGIVVPSHEQLTLGVGAEDAAARLRHKLTIANFYKGRFGHHPK